MNLIIFFSLPTKKTNNKTPYFYSSIHLSSQVVLVVKNPPANTGDLTWVWLLSWQDPLEEKMTTHSSIFAWKIPWTEERGRLQSMGLQKSRTRLTTWESARAHTHTHTHTHSLAKQLTCTSQPPCWGRCLHRFILVKQTISFSIQGAQGTVEETVYKLKYNYMLC